MATRPASATPGGGPDLARRQAALVATSPPHPPGAAPALRPAALRRAAPRRHERAVVYRQAGYRRGGGARGIANAEPARPKGLGVATTIVVRSGFVSPADQPRPSRDVSG